MPPRNTFVVPVRGEVFSFFYDRDRPGELHIYARHRASPVDAIETYFGAAPRWNEEHQRYETEGPTHTLYWVRYARDGAVVVISCFPH